MTGVRGTGAPQLCVVIAAYNAQATLSAQLAALADQEASFPWEVLICDNGSTDDTPALARHWQQRLPALRVIDASARRGPAAARNTGVAHTTAPYIAFCDADDVVAPGWLTGMHTALHHHPFVTGDTTALREGRGGLSWTVGGTYTKPFMPGLLAAGAGNMGIHRAVFQEVGGFEEAMATNEDTDLSWRVQLAGYPLVHRPEIVLHVRKRDGLRAVFRQAYASARGDRQLRHRYAIVIAAGSTTRVAGSDSHVRPGASQPAAAPAADEPRNPGTATAGRWRHIMARARSIRSTQDLADPVWRIGYALGGRFGRVDQSLPRVRPAS